MTFTVDGRPSLIAFGPQSKPLQERTLRTLWLLLHQDAAMRPLVQTVVELPRLWPLFSSHDHRMTRLKPGIIGLNNISDWMLRGKSSIISDSTCGIVAFPLLVLFHIAHYLQYLRKNSIKHEEAVQAATSVGGIQGFCIGFLVAVTVSSSSHESDLIDRACNAVRLSVGIGIYSDIGAYESGEQSAAVIRLKAADQVREVTDFSPSVHLGAQIDKETVTAVGPEPVVASLTAHTTRLGLKSQHLHLSCKVHNPENRELAKKLGKLCCQNVELALREAYPSRGGVRSNASGQLMSNEATTDQVIDSVLTSSCQWDTVMTAAAEALFKTGRKRHTIVHFGLADSIPLKAFERVELNVQRMPCAELVEVPPEIFCDDPQIIPSNPSVEPVAVIGMACRAPGADSVEALWEIINTGRSQVVEVPKTSIDIHGGYRASQDAKWSSSRKFFGNFISDPDSFDNSFFSLSSREALAMDPQQRLLLETAYQAVESSGYVRTHCPDKGDKVGVFIGASFVDYEEQLSAHPPTAYTSTGTIRAFLCGRISHYFGWSGPAEVIDTACSSSLVAVNRACKALQAGECNMAIAGGVNMMTTATEFLNLAKAGFLSPTGQCKPFDESADGYCRGEGAGIVVLKHLSQAELDGDNILAVIPAVATNQGGLSASITVPHSPSQVALYKEILRQAGMHSSEICYVEAHGTGTQVGDPLEMDSIRHVFGGSHRTKTLYIGSLKANIGHLETAAGVMSVIKAVLMVNKKRIPPLANHRRLNPKIDDLGKDMINIPVESHACGPERTAICVNSYGAAGSNAALLLRQAPSRPDSSSQQNEQHNLPYALVFGAHTKTALMRCVDATKRHLLSSKLDWTVAEVASTLSKRYRTHKFSWSQTCSKLEEFSTIEVRNGDILEAPRTRKKLVLAFPGQSRRNIACDRSIYDQCRIFRSYIHQCDDIIVQLGFPPIMPLLFDPDPISDLVILHCGTFAVQYACARSWMECGLKIDAVIGHSFGELTAIAVAQIVSLHDIILFIASRAELMKKHLGTARGSMMAIHTNRNEVLQLMDSLIPSNDSVEIACYNSKASHVVSGSESALARLDSSLGEDLKRTKLDVTHGFHSALFDSILEDLAGVARRLNFHQGQIPIMPCTEEANRTIDASRLVRHTREPVWFCNAVQRIERDLGPCVWLEAGMKSSITSMAKRACADPAPHCFVNLNPRSAQDGMLQLVEATRTLWSQGFSLTQWPFQSTSITAPREIWLPPYQFDKSRHWIPYIDNAMKILSEIPKSRIESLGETSPKVPETLVTLHAKDKYSINTTCQYYQKIVSSHAVLNKPLCPASMYLECATMALQITEESLRGKSVLFRDVVIDAPLGIDQRRNVNIEIERRPAEEEWTFRVTSHARETSKSNVVSHAKGIISFRQLESNSHLNHYERLIKDRVSALHASNDHETLRKNRIYSLFSRVVSYGANLKGMQAIHLSQKECVAEVYGHPQPSAEASTASSICDTATLDNFIQAAGISINTSEECGAEEVFVAVGIDDMQISAAYDLTESTTWRVYTSFTILDGSRARADVAVLSTTGALAFTINGINFAKLRFKRLRQLLGGANEDQESQLEKPETDLSPPSVDEARDDTKTKPNCNEVSETDRCLQDLLNSLLDLSDGEIPSDVPMGDLGLDSLGAAEMIDTLQSKFKVEDDLSTLTEMTLEDIRSLLGANCTSTGPDTPIESIITETNVVHDLGSDIHHCDQLSQEVGDHSEQTRTNLQVAPLIALDKSSLCFDQFASKRAFSRFWTDVAPRQDDLTAAYIIEAFCRLGVDLRNVQPGDTVSSPEVLPKHTRVLQRFWEILDQLGIIQIKGSGILKTAKAISLEAADSILASLRRDFPAYSGENDLAELTGPQLADFLTGKKDAARVLFANSSSQEILRTYYTESPQLACATDTLLDFIQQIVSRKDTSSFTILEVGGGFGGTTAPLARLLESLKCSVSYTFTDISPKLVKAAKSKFATYSWMDFQVLDLESDPPSSFRSKYDLVIGTNVVHATSNVVKSCSRLKDLLHTDGIIALSEVTCIVNWYDIVFGLLEGWWCAEDGREYPLQPPNYWISALNDAGFSECAVSNSPGKEGETQRIVIGRKASQPLLGSDDSRHESSAIAEQGGPHETLPQIIQRNPEPRKTERPEVSTVVYKQIGDLSIHADIMLPNSTELEKSRPIVLMIHGGGHMVFSKKDVRPYQTKYLLDCGMLPVSLDYRLCPEANVLDGAMSDIRDALSWARTKLPDIAAAFSITVNTSKILVIGWSTGATLAMSTAWMAPAIGLEPPNAILAFYGPSDYEAQVWQERRSGGYPPPEMTDVEIKSHLFEHPISHYDIEAKDPALGGMQRGNPRSELVFATFHSQNQVQILLHGFPPPPPSETSNSDRTAADISPLARVRKGTYRTPTFILHGGADEVVPVDQSRAFIDALKQHGVPCGIHVAEAKPHLYDLFLKSGTEEWEKLVQPGFDFVKRYLR